MTDYAIDLLYAWLQLGLPQGADAARIEKVVDDAHNYRFFTRPRLLHVERFAQFFVEREQLGFVTESFDVIRKTYHRRAMELHPDRNQSDPQAEERLKAINISYALVDAVHREARAYFEKDEAERKSIADDARFETTREAEAAGRSKTTISMSYEDLEAARAKARAGSARREEARREEARREKPPEQPVGQPRAKTPPGAIKYMAASIPRFIRASRLFYLEREHILGSRMVRSPGTHHGFVYDVIMLTENEFNRARLRLTMEGYGVQELTMSKLTPPYIPIDTKELIVPIDERHPAIFAREFFMREFGLIQNEEVS